MSGRLLIDHDHQDDREGDTDQDENSHPVVELNEYVIDSSHYYRLTNAYSGRHLALDVEKHGSNYALEMAPVDEFTGQYWRFIHLGKNVDKLQTRFLKNKYSLDIINDESNTKPHMAKTGDYTGKRWHLLHLRNGTF